MSCKTSQDRDQGIDVGALRVNVARGAGGGANAEAFEQGQSSEVARANGNAVCVESADELEWRKILGHEREDGDAIRCVRGAQNSQTWNAEQALKRISRKLLLAFPELNTAK